MSYAALLAVTAFVLALFGSVDHPWNWFGLRTGSLTRYLPSALMVLSFLLLVLDGVALKVFRSPIILAALAFTLVELIGSVFYIRLGGQLDQSYLGRGLNSLTLLTGAAVASNPLLRHWVSKNILACAVVIGFGGVLLLTFHSLDLVLTQFDQVVRVQIVYLMAGVTWISIRYPSVIFRLVIIALMFMNGYLSGKSTHYLVGLTFAGLTFGKQIMDRVIPLFRRSSGQAKKVLLVIMAPGILTFAGVTFFVLYQIIVERASRYEYDVRRIGIELRWKEFLESPLFGTGFASSSNVADIFGFGTNVPSHNDIMDILAGGGLVGITTFLAIVGTALFGRAMRETFLGSSRNLLPIHYFWVVIVFYVGGASGNPFFSEPYMAVPIWFSIGMMLGYRQEQTSYIQRSTRLAQRSRLKGVSGA